MTHHGGCSQDGHWRYNLTALCFLLSSKRSKNRIIYRYSLHSDVAQLAWAIIYGRQIDSSTQERRATLLTFESSLYCGKRSGQTFATSSPFGNIHFKRWSTQRVDSVNFSPISSPGTMGVTSSPRGNVHAMFQTVSEVWTAGE